MKNYGIFLIIFFILCSLSSISAGSFTDLQTVIDSSGDSIVLTDNYTYIESTDSSIGSDGISISKTLSIDGDGFSISGSNSSRIFNISGDNVKLSNMILKEGYSEDTGGAIYWSGVNASIVNCTFTSNNAYSGGAVYLFSNNSLILNSSFVNNSASFLGGALVIHDLNTSLITSNVFVNNSADTGGAICLSGYQDWPSLAFHDPVNVEVSFNVFLDNFDYFNSQIGFLYAGSMDNLSFNNNWWGVNWPEFRYFNEFAPELLPESWLVLSFKNTTDFALGSVSFNLSFNIYNSSTNSYSTPSSFIPYRFASFSTTSGVLTYNSLNFSTSTLNTLSFTSSGELNVSVIVDRQFLLLSNVPDLYTFSDLQALIDAASDKLVLTNNYSYSLKSDLNLKNGVNINKALSIIGENITLDAKGYSRIFNILSDDVSLVNLTLVNGYDSTKGGAIYWQGEGGVLNNSILKDSSSSLGGGIYWEGSNGLIYNSTFLNLSSTGSGGALYILSENLNILNSSFIENNASNGGAVDIEALNVYMSHSNFISNTADRGGALSWSSRSGYLNNSYFKDNFANVIGGAVEWSWGNAIINNSVFINNTANSSGAIAYNLFLGGGQVLNSLFINNSAYTTAGALSLGYAKNTLVYNNTFTNNTVSEGNGGALEGEYADNTQIINNTFTSNSAFGNGGAIEWEYSTSTNLVNNTFKDNTAGESGGAIMWAYSNTGIFINNTFLNNSANTAGALGLYGSNRANIYNNTFNFNKALDGDGGAIEIVGGSLDYINNSIFINNTASAYGGAILWGGDTLYVIGVLSESIFINNSGYYGGAVAAYHTQLTVYTSNFINNTAITNGGAVFIEDYNYLNIYNTNFTNNTAVKYGGGVYSDSGYSKIINSTFKENTAERGGGIYLGGVQSQLTNNTFLFNTASLYGGGLYINSKQNKIENSTFTSNNAQRGGGIYILNDNAVTFSNFTNNSASEHGGAIFISGSLTNITYSNFTSNSAQSYGGAIIINSNNVIVNTSNFQFNKAVSGGAIYSAESLNIITQSNFTNNSANRYGGALYLTRSLNNITYSSFVNNSASLYGGAILVGANNIIINTSSFQSNLAEYGGGILWSGDNGIVSNSNFTQNSAVSEGGGVYWNNLDGLIKESIFLNNTANLGGGLFALKSLTVNNTNFTLNTAFKGSGIYSDSDELYLNNLILEDNLANSTLLVLENTSNLFTATLYGGDNILDSIWNNKDYSNIFINNTNPVSLKDSNNGALLYQDERVYNQNINFLIYNENSLISNTSVKTNLTGQASLYLIIGDNLTVTHYKSNLYTSILNTTKLKLSQTYMDLLNLIQYALDNNLEEVNISADYKYNIESDSSFPDDGILIDKKLKINGNNHTLDGMGIVGLFKVSSNDVIISNLTIINHNGTFGGAIYWEGAGGEINDTNFINNTASGGGALYVLNNLSLNNLKFINNSAQDGGAIYILSGMYVKLLNSVFENNTSLTLGGAILWIGAYGYINNTNFTNNTSNMGGALWSGSVNSIIENSNFIENTAFENGGAILFGGGNQNLINSNIINNTASNGAGVLWLGALGTILNTNFTENKAKNTGGGILYQGAEGIIRDSSFIENTASTGSGIFFDSSNLKITNIFLKDNLADSYITIVGEDNNYTATLYGGDNILGGIWNNKSYSSISINNTNPVSIENSNDGVLLYQDNRLYNQSINILIYEGGILLYNITNNTNLYGNLSFIPFTGDNLTFSYPGSVLFKASLNSTLLDTLNSYTNLKDLIKYALDNNLEVNLTKNYIYNPLSDTSFPTEGLTINKELKINGNNHTLNGLNLVGLFNITNLGELSLSNLSIINHNKTLGGAIYSKGLLNLNNTIFLNNTATYGGALYLESDTLINNTSFINNSADNGSAIYSSSNNLKIYNINLVNNTAKAYELKLIRLLDTYNATLYIGDNILDGIYNSKDYNNIFINDTNPVRLEDSNNGALVYQDSRAVNKPVNIQLFEDSTLISNITSLTNLYGTVSSIPLSGNLINFTYKNLSNSTSILPYNTYDALMELLKYSLDNNIDTVNLKYDYTYNPLLDTSFPLTGFVLDKDIKILGNNHKLDGNGIVSLFVIESFNIYLSNLTISNHINSAIILKDGVLNIFNSSFINNTASYGGAINFIGGSGLINNTSFINNSADNGSAIYSSSTNLKIYNLNVVNNTAKAYALVLKKYNGEYNTTLYTGDNILDGIYNSKDYNNIFINDTNPVSLEDSNNGALLYQDSRAVNKPINIQILKDSNIILNTTSLTNLYGTVSYTPDTGDFIKFTYLDISNSSSITPPNSYSALYELISESINSGIYEITLKHNYTYNPTVDSSFTNIPITVNFKINGNGYSLNGNNTSNLFKLKDASLSLFNLSIINHNIVLDAEDSSLNGEYLIFYNNTNTILSLNSDININSSVFLNNSNPISITNTLNTNLNTNWWGDNNPEDEILIDSNPYTPEEYFILNFTINPESIYSGSNINLNTSLLLYNRTSNTFKTFNLPTRTLTYSGAYNNKFNLNLINTISLIQTNPGTFTINSTVDNEIISRTYTVQSNPTPPTPPGPTVTIIITANNLTVKPTDTINLPVTVYTSDNRPVETILNVNFNNENLNFNINGYTTINLNNPQTPGTYPVTISCNNTQKTIYIHIEDTIDINIPTTSYTTGEQSTVNIYIRKDNTPINTGTLTLSLNGQIYTSTVENGIAQLNIEMPNTPGTYPVNIRYTGEGDATQTTYFTITSPEVKDIILYINNTYYPINTEITIPVTVKDTNGENINTGTVSLTLNGQTYTSNVKEGQANINLQSPNMGIYTTTLKYTNNQITITNTSQLNIGVIKTIIKTSNLIKTYNTNISFTGYLLREDNTAIIGHHVNIKLTRLSSGASKTYDTVTDYKGEFQLPINLAPGEYTAEITYEGIIINNWAYTSSTNNANITVQKEEENKNQTILTAEKFNQPYGAEEYFTGTLTDTNGNPLAGQHIKVTLTRLSSGASKTYDTVTDYRGIYMLQINLAPGEYYGKSAYEGIDKYQPSNAENTITVYRI